MSSDLYRIDCVARLMRRMFGSGGELDGLGNLVSVFGEDLDIVIDPWTAIVDIRPKVQYTTAVEELTPADLLEAYGWWIAERGDPHRADDYLEAAHRWREENDA